MRYQYTGYGAFYQGLPAVDLDDQNLSADQLALLTVAVAANLYVPETGANEGTGATDGEIPTTTTTDATSAPPAGKSAKGKANATADSQPTPEAASVETPTEGTPNG